MAAVSEEAPRPRLIDAAVAARFAARFASASAIDQSYLMEGLADDVAALVAEAETPVLEETGFVVGSRPIPMVLTRAEWAVANVEPMLGLMAPLVEKAEGRMGDRGAGWLVRRAYGPAIGAQLGTVLGLLSQRVLGQYDAIGGGRTALEASGTTGPSRRALPPSPPAGNAIWFVGPNLVLTERRLGFVPRDFRLWVVLHELTHWAQFGGNDWMRGHFLSTVGRLLGSLELDARPWLERMQAPGQAGLPIAVRMLSSEQRSLFDQLQAFMSLLEGHGNFVMDRIAERTIPTQPRMRRTLREAAPGGLVAKLLGRLLGLDLKRLQYEEGQRFFDEILRVGGRAAVAGCFAGPGTLPTLDEIRSPAAWLERVAP
ncbi:MAG: zinc-dependent metalloprotease [Actinomycetota bacterium]